MAILLAAAGFYIAGARAQSNSVQNNKEVQTISVPYQKWLSEDVLWIITPEERAAFLKLPSDDERDQFIKQFWERRQALSQDEHTALVKEFQRQHDQASGPEDNVRADHYWRIAYANSHFAVNGAGWKSDRGRLEE